MRCLRKTGDKTGPERGRMCEAVGKHNIREYAVTYNDDLVRGKVGEGGKCGGCASIRRLQCAVE